MALTGKQHRTPELRESREAADVQAVQYSLSHWEMLVVLAEDGAVPIDNNTAEREMKRMVLNRKNSLFVGGPRGGRTAATLFSLIGSARLHEIEPWLYMRDILDRIATATRANLDGLLPDRWKLDHPEAHLPLGR